MPRRGENIYKRKDGRWEGRYIADRKPDGKAIYRSIYGTSYAQVREKLVAKRQETQKRQIGSCKLTVNELLALWQAENSQIKPTSRERYRALIELHIQPELGARKVRELNEEVLDAFVRKKLRSGRLDGRGGLAPKTVRDICIVMKSALKLAKRKYRYSGDGEINAPAIRQKQVEVFSQLESQRITAAVLKKPDRSSLSYLLCLETGLRLGEVCALRWSDIDLAEGVLRVQRTVYRINYGKRTELVLQTPKSENSVRAIPLTAKMLSVLRQMKDKKDCCLLTGTERPLEPRTMQYRFRRFLEKNNLTTIGSAAFSMSGLTTVDIPGGVSSIGGSAFSGCNSMVSMTLNEGISVIPNGMVQSGTALETVSLPQSLTKVEQYAFYECGALKTVKYAGTQDQWGKVTVEEYNDPLVAIMGEKTIAVTGVTLDREALELQLGGAEETLHAAVTPENATNRKASNGSDSSVCYKLVASGDYKKEYYVGDALDLSGIQLTAYWTSGKTTDVALKDVTISGYNKDEAGTQYVRLTYKEVNCLITVTVIPRSSKITVSVSIYGDSKHGASGGVHGLAMGGLSLWASEPNMEADTTETVWDVLKRVFSKHSMSVDASDNNQYNTIYISSINGLGEFDNGKLSGWMYTVNGSHPDVGVSARYLKQGDEIILHYTDDYTKEEGGMTPVEKPGTAKDVIDLIDKIGTVSYTNACKAKIDAARKAYDTLSTEEKAKVTNYKKLTNAEDQYKKLKEADDKAKAKAVDDLISKIGTVTINSGAAINAAWNGYNKLTAEQKERVTKLSTLQEATRKWNQLKADEVIKLIDKIKDPVTEKSSASIGAARKAYDALTKEQKNLVTNVKKLTDAETAYSKLTASEEDKEKAQEVIDKINKIGNVTKDSEQDIKDAREAYDALTDLQKKLVDNYDVLTAAETKLAMLKAMGKVSNPYITTGDYMEALGTPSVGSTGGEWMVIGLARSDRNVPGVENYYKKVLEYVAENIDPETGRLHKAKSTDNSRIIIALTAIGRDVTNVGGYDLLQGLSDLEFVKYQGNNGPIWALLALDSGNYPVPTGGTVTRQALIDEILRVQTSDGGWTVYGDKADSDMTGMALTALAPYYTKDLKVQEAIDKAIARLSEMQDEDGGYSTSYDGTTKIATSESISQVVTALSALGINADTDPRFVKNGDSVIDALLRYYVKGGGFKHIMDGEIDGMGTEQAYYALTAYYRFLSGKTSLYDMTDIIDMGGDVVTVEPTVPAATEPAQANTPWWIIAVCIFGGVGWGIVIGVVLVPKLKKKD